MVCLYAKDEGTHVLEWCILGQKTVKSWLYPTGSAAEVESVEGEVC